MNAIFKVTVESWEQVLQFAQTATVPYHIDGRKSLDTELWMLSRYWLGLADAGLLIYPITALKSESPDFIIENSDGTRTGIEVTEASTADFHRELVRNEQDARSGLHLDHNRYDRGWLDDEAEREWSALVCDAIRRKSEKLKGGNWRPADAHDLVIYFNGRAPGVNRTIALTMLRELFHTKRLVTTFRTVSIVDWEGQSYKVFYDVVGTCRVPPDQPGLVPAHPSKAMPKAWTKCSSKAGTSERSRR